MVKYQNNCANNDHFDNFLAKQGIVVFTFV